MLSDALAFRARDLSPLITPGAVVGTPGGFTLIEPGRFTGLGPSSSAVAGGAYQLAPAAARRTAFVCTKQLLARERRGRCVGIRRLFTCLGCPVNPGTAASVSPLVSSPRTKLPPRLRAGPD